MKKFAMAELFKVVLSLEKELFSKLKYNYFSSTHSNTKLRGKIFKFVGDGKIQLLKSKEVLTPKKEDLGKGKYFPADMS